MTAKKIKDAIEKLRNVDYTVDEHGRELIFMPTRNTWDTLIDVVEMATILANEIGKCSCGDEDCLSCISRAKLNALCTEVE